MLAAALLLGVVGVGLIGAAVASQQVAPLPPRQVNAMVRSAVVARDEGWEPRPSRGIVQPPAPEPVARPVSLQIPTIAVRSPIHPVGLAADGSVETPAPGPHYNHAAWYRHSPAPGALGPAILLGHVDSAAEGPSVFFRLGELTNGDRVEVTRADDSVVVFRVDRVQRYPKSAFPADLVYGDIDHAGLRILTCGGEFDSASGHYLDNIVVFATLLSAP
jgi:hypothetical protein